MGRQTNLLKGLWWQLCEFEIPQNLRRYIPIKPSLSEGQASAVVLRNVSHVQLPSLVCHVKSPIRPCILGQKKGAVISPANYCLRLGEKVRAHGVECKSVCLACIQNQSWLQKSDINQW